MGNVITQLGGRLAAGLVAGAVVVVVLSWLSVGSSSVGDFLGQSQGVDLRERKAPEASVGVSKAGADADVAAKPLGLQQGQSTLTVRHDLKGTLAWLTVAHPSAWFVDPDHMSGVQVTSEDPEDIADWYGQVPTTTWGVLHIRVTNEPGVVPHQPEPGQLMTTTNVLVDGYPGIRYEYQDTWGKVDAALVVTLTSGVSYIVNSEVSGATSGASAMRADLDNSMASIDFIDDHTQQVSWTRSTITAVSGSGNGFDLNLPTNWIVGPTATKGVTLSSPPGAPYSTGAVSVQIEPASADDAARWAAEPRIPYYMLQHETRSTSPAGLTTPLAFTPTETYLVKTTNNAVWLVAVSKPAQVFDTATYWLHEQTVYRITAGSRIAYDSPAAGYP